MRGGVHRLSGDFGHLADVEDQRVRHAARRRQPDLPLAGRRVGSDRDLDHHEVGDRGAGRLLERIRRFSPRSCADQLSALPSVLLGRPLALQLPELFPQQLDLLGVQPPVILDHLGRNARAGDERRVDAVEALPAQPDPERRALLAAGGIDVTDVRSRLRLRRGRRRQQAGQRPATAERRIRVIADRSHRG